MVSDTTIPWWQQTTVYQIYPRSFKDSTGNGIGDLEGIISKLDYLKDMGIETIWFSPFYESPQEDFGYDISNYRKIDPDYGDMATCEKLIEEIHQRDMKIILDMVMNHTSHQHAWFQESRSSRDNPKRDWYIWKNGKKPDGKKPPTNWKSRIGQNGWHYDKQTDQWYWSSFLKCQPDLNYRNPEVKNEMLDTVRFWLAKGVDGFRLDILDSLYEDPEFRDNPFMLTVLGSEKREGFMFQSTEYTIHHPDTIAFTRELRAVINEFSNPPRYLVGEVFGPIQRLRQYCGENENNGLNTVFLFAARESKLKASKFRNVVQTFEKYFPSPFIPTYVYSNHDIIRRISSLDNDIAKGKLQAAFQLTVRGIPFIYYGEEIGIPQGEIPLDQTQDAVAFRFQKYPKFIQKLVLNLTGEAVHRDNCRTPMQWTDEPHAGFTIPSSDPWLPVTDSYPMINVAREQQDPDSLWQCYKRFLQARKTYPALHAGQIQLLSKSNYPKNVLGYKRRYNSQVCYIFLNFSKKAQNIQIPDQSSPELIVSTTILSKALKVPQKIFLQPYEGVVIK